MFATASASANMVLEPPFIALWVDIDPRLFALVFTPPRIGILPGREAMATLSLSGASLTPADPAPAVTVDLAVLTEPSHPDTLTLVTPMTLAFDRGTTRHAVTLKALAGVVALEASTLTATVREDSATNVFNAEFTSTELPVDVIDKREFRWVFRSVRTGEELQEAEVVASAASAPTRLLVSLEGTLGARLFDDEQVEVSLAASSGIKVAPSELVVSADVMSPEVALTADIGAMSGELVLFVEGTTPDPLSDVTVMSDYSLPVQVVRGFILSFRTPADEVLDEARVLAEGSTEVVVLLASPGQLHRGEEVLVLLMADAITVVPDELRLSAQTPRASFRIDAAYDAMPSLGAVIASGTVRLDSARVVDARVLRTTLPVEVVARQFRLLLLDEEDSPVSRVLVPAGGSTPLRVRLSGVGSSLGSPSLGEGETLAVRLAYLNGTGVGLSLSTVEFPADNTEISVTLNAAFAATLGTLSAEVATPVNVAVEPASWPVEIVPREFALVFTPPQIGILVGEEETVILSLTGASLTPADPVVTVELTLSHPDTLTLVTPAQRSTLTFGATTMRHVVTLSASGGAAISGAALRAAAALDSAANVPNALFAPAELVVNVVVDQKKFTWILRLVETQDGPQLLVSLEGVQGERLRDDDKVDVSVEVVTPAGETVFFPLVVMSAGTELPIPEDAFGVLGEWEFKVTSQQSLPSGVSVAGGTIFRDFGLRFETSMGVVLESEQVLAGDTTEVMVALDQAGLLEDDEVVRVTLATTTVSVAPMSVMLASSTPSATLTIGAAAESMSGTVVATGAVEKNGSSVRNTGVRSATLAVTAEAAEFRLRVRVLLEGPLQ